MRDYLLTFTLYERKYTICFTTYKLRIPYSSIYQLQTYEIHYSVDLPCLTRRLPELLSRPTFVFAWATGLTLEYDCIV